VAEEDWVELLLCIGALVGLDLLAHLFGQNSRDGQRELW
jgi:hypothetical protein